jgi:hypothetical protein
VQYLSATLSQPASTADLQPLAPAQHKAQLWADGERHVYAVVMGSRVQDLGLRLSTAAVMDYDCLVPGALPPDKRASSPYLVHLKRESEFTDWLLFEASTGLGDWGVLALSKAPRLLLRGHLRELLQARLPEGAVVDLDWMDPVVLLAILPLFDAAGLSAFMGPVQSLVIAGATQWTTADYGQGQLQWRSVPLAKAS